MTIDEARGSIGAGVVYWPRPEVPAEDGTITRVGEQYVFVLYVGDRTPKATRPEDLTLLASKKAGLGVGHVWTNTLCPAYRTLNGLDCTCGAGLKGGTD